jgi:hypothetical protein
MSILFHPSFTRFAANKMFFVNFRSEAGRQAETPSVLATISTASYIQSQQRFL